MLRSSILGELSKNYILTAQAKGLRRGQLISRHALRNSLVPSITYIANTFGGLLGGSMITESVFSVPGIGSYALTAINNRTISPYRAMCFLPVLSLFWSACWPT